MRVGAARDEREAVLHHDLAESAGIVHHVLDVDLVVGAQRLAECHGLCGDDVHQRPALDAGEDCRVDLLGDLLVVGQDHAAARAAERLVRRRRDDVGMRERARNETGSDEAGEVRHVDEEVRADFIGDGAERREIDLARIGRAAGDDEARLVLVCELPDLIDIDQVRVGLDHVVHGLEPLARLVDGRAVRQVTAGRE